MKINELKFEFELGFDLINGDGFEVFFFFLNSQFKFMEILNIVSQDI